MPDPIYWVRTFTPMPEQIAISDGGSCNCASLIEAAGNMNPTSSVVRFGCLAEAKRRVNDIMCSNEGSSEIIRLRTNNCARLRDIAIICQHNRGPGTSSMLYFRNRHGGRRL